MVKGGGDVGTGQRARLYCNKGNYVGSEAAKSLAIKKRNKVGTKQNLAFSKLCYVRFRISRIFWDNEGPCLIQVSLQFITCMLKSFRKKSAERDDAVVTFLLDRPFIQASMVLVRQFIHMVYSSLLITVTTYCARKRKLGTTCSHQSIAFAYRWWMSCCIFVAAPKPRNLFFMGEPIHFPCRAHTAKTKSTNARTGPEHSIRAVCTGRCHETGTASCERGPGAVATGAFRDRRGWECYD